MSTPRYLDEDGLDGVLSETKKSFSKPLAWIVFLASVLVILLLVYFYNSRAIVVSSDLSKPLIEKNNTVLNNSPPINIKPKALKNNQMSSVTNLSEEQIFIETNTDTVVDHLINIEPEILSTVAVTENEPPQKPNTEFVSAATKTKLDAKSDFSDKDINSIPGEVTSPAKDKVITVHSPYVYTFKFSSKDIKPVGVIETSRLTHFIEQCDNTIVIVGYTCNLGPEEFNYQLGLNRATAMQQFLIELGVNPDVLTIRSEGMNNPVASNNSKLGRQLNRRVELLCTK